MAFRAFYALPAENFATSGGQHTNAVYGFLSMLANIIAEEKPEYVGVAFDVGRKTFRTEMFPEYKAQREAAPEEFRGQVDLIREVLGTLGITTLSRENFEADDIVATLATHHSPVSDARRIDPAPLHPGCSGGEVWLDPSAISGLRCAAWRPLR